MKKATNTTILIIALLISCNSLFSWNHKIVNNTPYRMYVELRLDPVVVKTMSDLTERLRDLLSIEQEVAPFFPLYPELGYVLDGGKRIISPCAVVVNPHDTVYFEVGPLCITDVAAYSLDKSYQRAANLHIDWYRNQCSGHIYTIGIVIGGYLKIFMN